MVSQWEKKRSSIQKNIVNDRNEEERKKLKKEKWCFLKEHPRPCGDTITDKISLQKGNFGELVIFLKNKIV